MDNKRKVLRINNLSIKWKLNVAVYCRVSTTHAEQIESLHNQVEYYRQLVSKHIDWVLLTFMQIFNLEKAFLKGPNSKECWRTLAIIKFT